MRIAFHTNLDEAKEDVGNLCSRCLDTEYFPVPRVGERVRFRFDRDKFYELEVVGVVHNYTMLLDDLDERAVHVELHIPRTPQMTIAEWIQYIRRHRFGRDW